MNSFIEFTTYKVHDMVPIIFIILFINLTKSLTLDENRFRPNSSFTHQKSRQPKIMHDILKSGLYLSPEAYFSNKIILKIRNIKRHTITVMITYFLSYPLE